MIRRRGAGRSRGRVVAVAAGPEWGCGWRRRLQCAQRRSAGSAPLASRPIAWPHRRIAASARPDDPPAKLSEREGCCYCCHGEARARHAVRCDAMLAVGLDGVTAPECYMIDDMVVRCGAAVGSSPNPANPRTAVRAWRKRRVGRQPRAIHARVPCWLARLARLAYPHSRFWRRCAQAQAQPAGLRSISLPPRGCGLRDPLGLQAAL